MDILCLQEINLNWTPEIEQQIKKIRESPAHSINMCTSHSTKNTDSNYQPGRTFTAALGSWGSHVIHHRTDNSGMGRWSFLEFEGKAGNHIIVMSRYWACSQPPRLSSNTYYDQQYQILLNQGHPKPNPHKQFLTNIITQILTWQTQGKAVHLCMDINHPVTKLTKPTGISRLTTETELIDLQNY